MLSVERSGSTLLRYCLDTHSEIAAPGELVLGRCCKHLLDLAEVTHFEAGYELGQVALSRLRRALDSPLTQYAQERGKSIWCDKAPANLEFLEYLRLVFPEARYVLLYRHCLDNIRSNLYSGKFGFMKENYRYALAYPTDFITGLIQNWCDKTSKMLLFEQSCIKTSIPVRYEDLVFQPEKTLRSLLMHFELDWEPELLQRVFRQYHTPGGGDPNIRFATSMHSKSVGLGATLPMAAVPNNLTSRANELLANLGYPGIGRWGPDCSPLFSVPQVT